MNNTFKALTSIALLASTAQLVHAHAGFKDQIKEGSVKTWNAVTITHGCNTNIGGESNSQPHKDVIALSAIFPNSPGFGDVIIRGTKGKAAVAEVKDATGNVTTKAVDGFTVGEEDKIADLSKDIVGSGTSSSGVPLVSALSLVNVGGAMFANNIPKVDSKGNVRGWQSWSGTSPYNSAPLLESAKKPDDSDIIETTGLSPFGIKAFAFKPESCAKTLKIRVAVANWCEKGKKSYNSPSRVDLWIGHMTTKFNDPLTMPSANATPVFWSTLTVNRDLARNPLPGTKGFNPETGATIDRSVTGWATGPKDAAGAAVTSTKIACSDTADYDTVYIEPSNDDIDNLLPISAAKYPAGANGALYWPTK